MRAGALIVVVVTTLLFNAAAVVVAVANGWPAEFDAHNDPHHVSAQWIGDGTAISAPVAPLVALAIFAVLAATRRRRWAVVGGIGALIVGVLAIIGQFGEPTFFHPEDALEAVFHSLGLIVAIAIVVAGGREAVTAARAPARPSSIPG